MLVELRNILYTLDRATPGKKHYAYFHYAEENKTLRALNVDQARDPLKLMRLNVTYRMIRNEKELKQMEEVFLNSEVSDMPTDLPPDKPVYIVLHLNDQAMYMPMTCLPEPEAEEQTSSTQVQYVKYDGRRYRLRYEQDGSTYITTKTGKVPYPPV